jgi:hypothetical protein
MSLENERPNSKGSVSVNFEAGAELTQSVMHEIKGRSRVVVFHLEARILSVCQWAVAAWQRLGSERLLCQ